MLFQFLTDICSSLVYIFKIAVSKESTWVGGTEYNGPSLLVYNTGGGKAIYVDQEVDIDDM